MQHNCFNCYKDSGRNLMMHLVPILCHRWIKRKWDCGHRPVKGLPLLLYRTPRLKETQLQIRPLCCFWSFFFGLLGIILCSFFIIFYIFFVSCLCIFGRFLSLGSFCVNFLVVCCIFWVSVSF